MISKVISLDKPTVVKSTWQVKSMFRLCLCITFVLILIISLTSVLALKCKAMEEPGYYLSWDVIEGDTLWSIAKGSLPQRRDIRDYISEIKEINQLQTSNILAGQQLQIPIYHKSLNLESAVQLGMNNN